MRVPGRKDAKGHVEVDVLIAIDVVDTRAARVDHEQGVRVIRLERARDAERQRLLGALVELRGRRRPAPILLLLAREDARDAIARNCAIGRCGGRRHVGRYLPGSISAVAWWMPYLSSRARYGSGSNASGPRTPLPCHFPRASSSIAITGLNPVCHATAPSPSLFQHACASVV